MFPRWSSTTIAKLFRSIEQYGRQCLKQKKKINDFSPDRWMDLEIISQESYLGNPLPKLPKLLNSATQVGRQC